jgi:AGZA family xanthine/uracil permease-like MFS transporter
MSNILALHRDEIEMRTAETAAEAGEEGVQNNRPSWFQRWRKGFSALVQRMDTSVAKSPVGRVFRLKESGHVSLGLHTASVPLEIAHDR